MDRHDYVRGEILKYREDFEKSVLWLADWLPDVADRIKRGTIKEWVILLEHKIYEIVRLSKPGTLTDEE